MPTQNSFRLLLAAFLVFSLTGNSFAVYQSPRILGISVIPEHHSPRACFKWSQPLLSNGFNYNDYIEVFDKTDSSDADNKQPRITTATVTNKEQLCVTALRNGRDYEVHFLPGLPFRSGPPTTEMIRRYVWVDHREASISFVDDGYILPTESTQTVSLKVINTGEFTIHAYRINPAMVNQYLRYGHFNRPVDRHEMDDRLFNDGELLGSQSFQLEFEKNKVEQVQINLDELIDRREAAAYILVAEADVKAQDKRYKNRPTQFVVLTDLALTSYHHSEGLNLFARSYQSGAPRAGVRVELIARNFDILGSTSTDADGHASFPAPLMGGSGGRTPTALYAYSGEEGKPGYQFALLDLTRQPLDLSDRDVAGVTYPRLLSAYLYLERGVYRPGETFNLTALVRNRKMASPGAVPLTLTLIRPDGIIADEQVITSESVGALTYSKKIAASARTGEWRVKLYLDPNKKPLGETSFLVEDYVPTNIKVTMTVPQGVIDYRSATRIELGGDYLYGAPAANLPTEAGYTIEADRSPFSQWKKFRFGEEDHQFTAQRGQIDSSPTDQTGRARITLESGVTRKLFQDQLPTVPVRIALHGGIVEPSGRIARRLERRLIGTQPMWSGIRPLNDEDSTAERISFPSGGSAGFELVSVNKAGIALPAHTLEYVLVKEEWDYHWYRLGSWRYEITRFDVATVEGGTLTTGSDGMNTFSFNGLEWGHYRVEVTDPGSGSLTSLRFHVGWWGNVGKQSATPDNVKLALERAMLEPGEEVQLHIEPPFDGRAQLVVATDRVVETRNIEVTTGGTNITLQPQASWGTEAHLLVTVYRPGTVTPGPARAIGVARVSIRHPEYSGEVKIESADKIEPNQTIEVRLKTRGLNPQARVTLAAVDEGILGLTRFSSPDPASHFFAKKQIGVALHDLYGHLLQFSEGELLKLHFGGDAALNSPTPLPPETFVKPLALFSGLVSVDEQGEAVIRLKIPQFNGRLRLMAVAFDDQRFASAAKVMTVRDPVVVLPTLPRFIAVDDVAEIGLHLNNLEGPEGLYTMEWSSDSGLSIGSERQQAVLNHGEEVRLHNFISGRTPLSTTINLQITDPGGAVRRYDWRLTVQETRLRQHRSRMLQLLPGVPVTVDPELVSRLLPGSVTITSQVSRTPALDIKWLLDELDRYPFGCLEQTTSRAFPLLYLDAFKSTTKGGSAAIRERINDAILRIESMQTSFGAFALWPHQNKGEMWLTAYATHFLIEARERGFDVHHSVLANALSWIERKLRHSKWLDHQAYALYLLAREGKIDVGTLRYTLDQVKRSLAGQPGGKPGMVVLAQLGAAFRLIGDEVRSKEAFSLTTHTGMSYAWNRINYGSTLRDLAAVSAFMQEGNGTGEIRARAINIAREAIHQALVADSLSTQEKSWLILMSHRLQGQKSDTNLARFLTVEERALPESGATAMLNSSLKSIVSGSPVLITNTDSKPLYLALTVSGVDQRPQVNTFNDLDLTKTIRNLASGQFTSLATAGQGEMFVVTLRIPINSERDMELSLIDLLPAGFEIENKRLGGLSIPPSAGNKKDADDPAGETSPPTFEEMRDDRYMAVYTLARGKHSAAVNKQGAVIARYLMRAVTPGKYRLPAAYAEDMYRPEINATTSESSVKVIRRKR